MDNKEMVSEQELITKFRAAINRITSYNVCYTKLLRIGLGIRAVSLDYQAAGLMGINVDRVISIAFSLSGALAGLIGVLGATYYNAVNPHIGFAPGMKSYNFV